MLNVFCFLGASGRRIPGVGYGGLSAHTLYNPHGAPCHSGHSFPSEQIQVCGKK